MKELIIKTATGFIYLYTNNNTVEYIEVHTHA